MTTRAAYLPIALTLAALLFALALADACQAQHRAGLDLPAAVEPVAGNRAAATLVAQWHAADGDKAAQDRIGGELCRIAWGMYWRDVGAVLGDFLREEGCYPMPLFVWTYRLFFPLAFGPAWLDFS